MHDLSGSIWRKWDLHVHTPASLVHSFGADAWPKFLDALERLPPEFKVIGINDYIFVDGYKRVLAEKGAGRLSNIDLILPVIELRLDKFGGSKSHLSRVNYHVIFSDEISAEIIESQFLNALSSRYILTPEYDELRTSGKWVAVPTRASLEDLGRKVIESVPPTEKSNYGSPLVEGFNNLCISHADVLDVLGSHYFNGKVITAVGKTEWADIKWNDQSIADKKTIINGADLVFTSAISAAHCSKARQSLTNSAVNDRLLDCSDAHAFADSTEKDRLGNCFTWIKADPTFEGLRQAVFEYANRVRISDDAPLEPFLQIKRVTLTFPPNTELHGTNRHDLFCFAGGAEFAFSPYLTCIIGGRGSGKSTLLNVIHEKLDPGSTGFFRENRLLPATATLEANVEVEGIAENRLVEFLQQNEIEQFATNYERLTGAILARLRKLDTSNTIQTASTAIQQAVVATRAQVRRLQDHHELLTQLATAEKELKTQQGLVQSIESPEYKALNADLANLNRELVTFRNDRVRLERLCDELRALTSRHAATAGHPLNAYSIGIRTLIAAVDSAVEHARQNEEITRAQNREAEVAADTETKKDALDKYLRSRGLSAENLVDLGLASQRVAQREQEITDLRGRIASVEQQSASFSTQRELASAYKTAVDALLSPINDELKSLSAEVKPIELRYDFDEAAFRFGMIRYVVEAIGAIESRAARGDYVESKLKEIDFSSLGSLEHTIGKIPEDGTTYAGALREFLSGGINYEVLTLEAELLLLDVEARGRITVMYDGKPVANSSFGQRCTAVIVVLLLLGNTPIIIDEPEAHLDSALIAKYLVELVKSRKQHRQIVFATHNANFVINGDAELIHTLSMDESKLTKTVSTTIENLEHRDALLALEGGERAFHQREQRYRIK